MDKKIISNPGCGWRAANILNKPAIPFYSFEPPTIKCLMVFLFKLIKGMGMKKILLCALLFLPVAVVADTMCVRDSSLVVSLGPSRDRSGVLSGADWIVYQDQSNGRVLFQATCLSEVEGLGRTSGEGEFYGVGIYENQTIVANAGLGGLDTNGNERKYCWVRVIHPAISKWVFATSYSSADACNGVGQDCLFYAWRFAILERPNVQKGLYRSIGL